MEQQGGWCPMVLYILHYLNMGCMGWWRVDAAYREISADTIGCELATTFYPRNMVRERQGGVNGQSY